MIAVGEAEDNMLIVNFWLLSVKKKKIILKYIQRVKVVVYGAVIFAAVPCVGLCITMVMNRYADQTALLADKRNI